MYADNIDKQEVGIVLSNAYKGQHAKVCIPAMLPDLKTDEPYNVKKNKPIPSNIVSGNRNKLDLRSYYVSNYTEIKATRKVFKHDKIYVSILGSNDFEMAGEYNEQ